MRTKAKILFLGVLIIAVFSSSLSAGSDSYTVVNGPKDFYYGHVSNIDGQEGPGPYILRENDVRKIPAVLNMPLMPGDTIVTPGTDRLEIQFDNGTILRLDAATEIKIETILAESLTTSKMMTNLVLKRGRVYAMFKEYSPREICQFLLPTAAVRLRHQTVAILGVREDNAADVRVRRGKADILYGPDAAALKKQIAYSGDEITIGTDHRYALQPFPLGTPFEEWNISQNENFNLLHDGLSMLPKPVRRWPLAVQYFAEKWSSLFGEWIYDPYLGYVWRPADNDHPYGRYWQPFYLGQWIVAGNQMYWVPSEPWGWVPYHLGLWHWDQKRGWLWIPGSAFAPAWVDWMLYADFYAWQPDSIYDWLPTNTDWWKAHHHTVNPPTAEKVTKDQLALRRRPAYEMPREFKSLIKALQRGLEKRDPALLASLRGQGESGLVVSRDRLISPRIQDSAVSLKTFLAGEGSGRSLSALNSQETVREAAGQMTALSRQGNGPAIPPDRYAFVTRFQWFSPALLRASEPRFRDWNPDVKTGTRFGVSIRYDSASNRIYSPELRIQSGDRWSLRDRQVYRETGRVQFEATSGNFYSGSINQSANGSAQTGSWSGGHSSEAHSNSGGSGTPVKK